MEIAIRDINNLHLSIPEKISLLEEKMKQLPQLELPVKHYFADGLYVRELLIPAGTLLTGRKHRNESICFVSCGEIDVVNDAGEARKIVAPYTFVSRPGKKVGFAIKNTIFTSIHANPTNERDIEAVEAIMYDDTPEDIERYRVQRHHDDYREMLAEYGLSYEIVRAISEITTDRVSIKLDDYGFILKPSPIEGLGIFALKDIERGHIAPARINCRRTELGRYANHSSAPNAKMVLLDNGDLNLVATRNINAGEEVTIDYRESLRLANVIPIIKREVK